MTGKPPGDGLFAEQADLRFTTGPWPDASDAEGKAVDARYDGILAPADAAHASGKHAPTSPSTRRRPRA